jgi:glycosyltransferase involved in cell wall biosynthesis
MQQSVLVHRAPPLNASPAVSVVVPFFDEATNLPVLIARLKTVLDGLDRATEVVLVDDGSTDGSPAAAEAAIDGDRRFRLVRLRTNYGKSAALAAGRDHSAGEIVVTMDADLQDPPEAIPQFLAAIERGNDVVAGWRLDRRAPWQRRWFSALFNRCVRAVCRVSIHDMNCGMKAYRRRVLEAIHLSRGMHRFTAILAHGNGFRLDELRVPNDARLSGTTKYGAGRYFEAAIGFVGALYVRSPARSPLATFAAPGVVVMLAALVGAGVQALWGSDELTRRFAVWLALVALALLGAMLLVAGLLGELILQRFASSARPGPPYTLHDEQGPGSRPS